MTKSDLDLLLAETHAAATRLRRRFRLSHADFEDFRQDLLLDLIRRLPAFDPERGTLGAFAGTVLRNNAVRIAARLIRGRRAAGGPLLSLDVANEHGLTLGDQLTEEANGLAAWYGRNPATATTEQRIALDTTIDRLQPQDQALCAAVAHHSVDQLVGDGFGSRAGIYRRLRELRLQLTAHGLQAA